MLLMFDGMSAEEYFGEGSPPLALSASLAVQPSELGQIFAGAFRQDALVTPHTVVINVDTPGAITWTGQSVGIVVTPGAAVVRLADQKAAAVLGVSVDHLQKAAVRAWGNSLTDERDRRLEERLGGQQVNPRSRQAIRGHITRELLGELREAGVQAKRRSRTRGKGR
jgi:hypothetical protein